MKKIILLVCCIFFISSCWREEVVSEGQKQEFLVEVKKWDAFVWNFDLKKTGKIRSSQDILLTGTANGRVNSLFVKSWDSVEAGQLLATLEDSVWNYQINLERAQNGVERANLSYESTKIQLEKQLIDTKTQLATLERNYSVLEKDSEQNLIQAKNNYENSVLAGESTTSSLQLQQIDDTIKKLEIDYENQKVTNAQTLSSYKSLLITNFNSLVLILKDVSQMSDEILWVSKLNERKNDDFEDYLWVKDMSQKNQSELQLQELLAVRDGEKIQEYQTLLQSSEITEVQVQEIFSFIEANYEKIKIHLNSIETTVNNSTLSVWSLSEAQISQFTAQIDVLQGTFQWYYSAFLSYSSWVKTFLQTYLNTQNSLLKSIELQKNEREIQKKRLESSEISASVTYEKTLIGIEDAKAELKTQIETAQRNIENAEKNYDITLRSLENAIREAEIAYKSALKEVSKLSITSPINGTVSDVFLDKWQEINIGTKTFNILSDSTPEVEIAFSSSEKDLIQVWQEVFIDIGVERITWKIYSLSDIADANLNYKSTIVFTSGTVLIGDIANVVIPVTTDTMLVPVNIVTTQGDGQGYIQTLSGTTFAPIRVRLWKVYSDSIEILSCSEDCKNLEIVLSDISNFDPTTFVIQKK